MSALARIASGLLLAAVSAGAQMPPQDLARAVGFGQSDGTPVAVGRDYKVLLRADGLSFVPALGDRAPHNLPLDLAFASAWCGTARLDAGPLAEPSVDAAAHEVRWLRGPGLSERLDVAPEGLELSWELATPPAGAGDLVVELRLRTELPLLEQHDDGLLFADEALGGVRVGGVVGRDADGREVAGGLSCEPITDGSWRLRCSLPASFVDTARFPLVLDPPITPWVPVASGSDWPPGKPRHDAQASLPFYYTGLCIWVSDYSAADHDILGRVVYDPTISQPPTSLTLIDVSPQWDDLPVISAGNVYKWALVAWVRREGSVHRIRGMLTKAEQDPADVVFGTPTDITPLDAALARPGVNSSLLEVSPAEGTEGCVIYGTQLGQVRLVHVQTDDIGPLGQLELGSTSTLFSGVPGAQPTIAPSRNVLKHTLVAWRQPDGVHGQMLNLFGSLQGVPKLLKPAGFPAVGQPRVDGAWDAFALVTTEDHPTAGLRVTLTYVDELLSVSPHYVVTEWASFPGEVAVAQDIFDVNTALRVAAFSADPAVSSAPVDTSTWSGPVQGSVLAKMPWGVVSPKPVSAPSVAARGEILGMLAVAWADAGGNVRFQFGSPWGPGGAVVPVGVPCGEGGTLSADSESALGNYLFAVRVDGTSPLATTAILNVGFVQPPVTCGPCSIEPLQLLVAMVPAVPGLFTLDAPLPGDLVFANLALEAQAIVSTPGAGGCAGIKDWSVSNRLQFTLK